MSFRDLIRRPLFWPLVLLVVVILIADLLPSRKLVLPPGVQLWTGVLQENPRVKPERSQVTVELSPRIPDLPRKILLSAPFDLSLLQRGDTIEWKGQLKLPIPYRNPGGFDYLQFLKRQGIGATSFVKQREDLDLLEISPPGWASRISNSLKKQTRDALQLLGSSQAQAVTLALLWGDESGLDDHTTDLFRNQGLSHLLVISGLHFSVLALVLFWLGLGPFKIFPTLCLYLPARKIAAGFSLLVLTFYFFLCESNPSVTRAYVAVGCYLTAIVLGRSRDALNILFLAALVILLIHPDDLFSVSFQFSFLAVAGLLFLFPKINAGWEGFLSGERITTRALRYGLDLLLVNVSVFLVITPIMIFYFYRMNLNGLFMNLWAVPAIEMILVPLGLLGFVFLPIVYSAGIFFLGLTVNCLDWILSFLDLAAQHLPAQGLVFPPHGYELACYYVFLLILCLAASQKMKRVAWISFLLFTVVDLSCWFGWPLVADRFRITQLDVGQGDSILIDLPKGHHLLVDGGGSTYFDVGENVLIPFLLYERIPRLDAICVTHADTDHYLGLIPVVRDYPVKELWWNGKDSDSPLYQNLFEEAAQKHIPARILAAGDRISEGSAQIEVLSPGKEEQASDKDNIHSLVMTIKALGQSALLTGDTEKPVEQRLVRTLGPELHVDYLKIPHHGSHSSSSEDFLKAVSPQVASLGTRIGNRFGHPHADTLARYQQLGIPVFRTDLQGAVTIDLEERKLQVETYVGGK